MTLWHYIVIGLSLLSLVWLIRLEAARKNRARRWLRILTTVIMIVSLACLALPVTVSRRTGAATGEVTGILLTEGYNKDSLEDLLHSLVPGRTVVYKDMREWEYACLARGNGSTTGNSSVGGNSSATGTNSASGNSLAGRNSLATGNSSAVGKNPTTGNGLITDGGLTTLPSTVHILGYGLTADQWEELCKAIPRNAEPPGNKALLRREANAGNANRLMPRLVFHPSAVSTGILSISWERRLYTGEMLHIQGICLNTSDKPLKIVLAGQHTRLDSVLVPPPGPHANAGAAMGTPFGLKTIPAQSGQAVYTLELAEGQEPKAAQGTKATEGTKATQGAKATEGTKATEGAKEGPASKDVPASGNTQEQLPVEVLPVKPLKILFLAASPGAENHFLADWLSQSGHQVAMRTMISKDKWEQVFINMRSISLDRLSPSLLKEFDLVIADNKSLEAAGPQETAGLQRQVEDGGLGLVIRADSLRQGFYSGLFTLATTRDSLPVTYIRERPGLQALVRDSLSRMLAGCSLFGSGRVLLSTLQNTFPSVLAGRRQEFGAQWATILSHAVKREQGNAEWRIRPAFPVLNEQVKILLHTGEDFPVLEQLSGFPGNTPRAVYLSQDPMIPFSWEGCYQPERTGWQYSRTLKGDTCRWFAWGPGDWLQVRRQERLEATDRWLAERRDEDKARGGSDSGAGADADSGAGAGVNGDRGDSMGGGINGERVDDAGGGAHSERHGNIGGSDGEGERSGGGNGYREPLPKIWFYIPLLLSCLFLWIEKKRS